MVSNYGYRLWDHESSNIKDEMNTRLKYLLTYTTRVETTGLNSLKKIFKHRKETFFNKKYYGHAIINHAKKLKHLYSEKRMVIPELDEVEFYIWTLKYARNQE